MKRINIFKTGKHTSMGGMALEFSETDLQSAVAAYDPQVHEAPIVVGHPRDNLPAYGWISGLEFSEERGMDALPHQVDSAFAEMVTAGRFKKVSAAFYTPESPNNPVPGSWYLRHVGFLGAQPPAVKGLKAVEFSEDEEGVVEFEEPWNTRSIASTFRRLREFLIDKFSKDEVDDVIPDYMITDLEDSARRQMDKDTQPSPAFSETKEDPDMDKVELEKQKADLKAREDALAAQQAEFAERETMIKASEEKQRRDGIAGRIESLVKAGKILPAEKPRLMEFACTLATDAVVEFGEGDNAKKESLVDVFFSFAEAQKPRVDIKEHSKDENTEKKPADPNAVANRIIEYTEEQRQKGVKVTVQQAAKAIAGEFADK